MNRRQFLAACSVGLVGLAGCGADTDSTEPAGDTPDPTPAGVTDSPDGSRSPTERTATPAEPPELEPVWTVSDLAEASAAVSLALPDGARTREPASVAVRAASETGTPPTCSASGGWTTRC